MRDDDDRLTRTALSDEIVFIEQTTARAVDLNSIVRESDKIGIFPLYCFPFFFFFFFFAHCLFIIIIKFFILRLSIRGRYGGTKLPGHFVLRSAHPRFENLPARTGTRFSNFLFSILIKLSTTCYVPAATIYCYRSDACWLRLIFFL